MRFPVDADTFALLRPEDVTLPFLRPEDVALLFLRPEDVALPFLRPDPLLADAFRPSAILSDSKRLFSVKSNSSHTAHIIPSAKNECVWIIGSAPAATPAITNNFFLRSAIARNKNANSGNNIDQPNNVARCGISMSTITCTQRRFLSK